MPKTAPAEGLLALGYRHIWLVDFEYFVSPGGLVVPICMVARDLRTGNTIRLWQDDLQKLNKPPYDIGEESLFVAYYAVAELSCHLALGWALPTNILDLCVEFKNLTNGLFAPCGKDLLGALVYFGLPAVSAEFKASMRNLALSGGPWSATDKVALLDYCLTDVVALEQLLTLAPWSIDVPRALLRGKYMVTVANIERTGIPVAVRDLQRLRDRWDGIKLHLIHEVDRFYNVYDGETFKSDQWRNFTVERKIPWPEHPSGALMLDADTFRDVARSYPEVNLMKELRASLSRLRLEDFAVGADGRSRCSLWAFGSKTARNQPSSTRFMFGPAVWIRGLIEPQPGHALAYVDYSQQEFGIGAALSLDPAMMHAYASGDPYLAFATQAGAAPPDATKASHGDVREAFKSCALAVQYGMGRKALACKIGQSEAHAQRLLDLHRQTYPSFWRWSDAALDHALLTGSLPTVFGWEIHVLPDPNPRSLRNFVVQGNASEMLRLASGFAEAQGVRICAPVHDALLIEAPIDEIDAAVAKTELAMSEASKVVLGGFQLRTDVKIFRHPDRYSDPRGEAMWRTVWRIINKLEGDS